ncbi:MAG: tetratricopeptide repeat protein, partial [Myxococcota bacterium]
EEADLVLKELEDLYRDESLGLHGSPGFCAARATFAREKGENELAEQRYEKCLELFPSEALVLEEAVQFFDDSGQFERSEQILARALEDAPAAHAIRFHLVRRLLARGAAETAEKLVREATTLPSLADAATGWSNLALWEIHQGRFDAAADAFARARDLDPTHSVELSFGYADALAVAGRYEQALRVAEETGLPTYQALVRGRVALLRGDPQQALEQLSEGVRLWPDNAMARYYLAVAAEQTGDFALAVEQYRYAIRIDVRSTDAYLRLARLHAAEGRLDEAVSILSFQPGGRPEELTAGLLHLEILARLDLLPPTHLQRFFSHPDRRARALAAVARGRTARRGPAEAAKYLREQKIDLTDPVHAPALEALVEALGASGHSEEGLVLADAGQRRHPEAAAFHALRGRALILSRRPSASARAAYERALAIDAGHSQALIGLARLHVESGKRDSALEFYERALIVAPDDRDTARDAAKLLSALERRDEAEERLAGLLRAHPYDAPAALALAELRLARGADDERTRELVRRAVHFRGGPPAEALLERLGSRSKTVISTVDGG